MERKLQKARTRQELKDSFQEMLVANDFRNISIEMICSNCGCHRTTFYHYYSSVTDLLEDIKKDLVQLFETSMSGDEKGKDELETLSYMLKLVEQNRGFFKAYFSVDNQKFKLPSLEEKVLARYTKVFSEAHSYAVKSRRVLVFYCRGIAAVIKDWIDEDCQDSYELVARDVLEFLRKF